MIDLKIKAKKIVEQLEKSYPNAYCTLNYTNAFELLIGTQLAAQCTDERVNRITKVLFENYKTPEEFANISEDELQTKIKSAGFYKNKARNIIASSQILLKRYDGNVPGNMEELLELPGVGRKTANVILGEIFNISGVVVDTHVKRTANRLGLTKNSDPVKIENDLMEIVHETKWIKLGHQLVFHGRQVCDARKPKCTECTLMNYCDFYKSS